MRVAFRADAGLDIGTGHVMRCLALADQLRHAGARTSFVYRELPGHLGDLIAERGHRALPLPPEHPGPPTDESADAALTLRALSRDADPPDPPGCDWIVVDHYRLGVVWEQAVRSAARHLLAIDDLPDRPHTADLLLDPNLQPDDRPRSVAASAASADSAASAPPAPTRRALLGPRYALLRPEFAHAAAALQRQPAQPPRRVLVFLGGADRDNITARVLRAFLRLARPGIALDVVLGRSHPAPHTIAELCARLPSAAIHQQVRHMHELMARADLAVGAGGSATWERCCLGLPTAVISVADNQVAVARQAHRHGLIDYLGPIDTLDPDALADGIARLLDDPDRRAALSDAGRCAVDGLGARRVALAMRLPLERPLAPHRLALRPLTPDDARSLYSLQSVPGVRAFARNPQPPTWPDHLAWFQQRLASDHPPRWTRIVTLDGLDVGVVRLDPAPPPPELSPEANPTAPPTAPQEAPPEAPPQSPSPQVPPPGAGLIRQTAADHGSSRLEVSILIDPACHGAGVGAFALERAADAHPRATLIAYIHPDNHASIRLFARAGYRPHRDHYLRPPQTP